MLENFKGNIHLLTKTDRIRGGKARSKRKSMVNGLKNLRHGKYSENYRLLLTCFDCPFIGRCNYVHKGYCVFLLDEISMNKRFRKEVMRKLTIPKDTNNILDLVKRKYQMNKHYVEFLKSPAFHNSDSKG